MQMSDFSCVGPGVRAKALFKVKRLLVPLLTGPASHCAGPKIAARGLSAQSVAGGCP